MPLTSHDAELVRLNQLYQSSDAQLFVLYGKRRVGKTELLRAFVEDKPHLFFIATLSSDADQLASFSQLIWKHLYGEEVEDFSYPSWEVALRTLATLPNRPVIIINEITYLLEGNREFLTTLQTVWTSELQRANLFLLLSGSYENKIERELFAGNSFLASDGVARAHLSPRSLPASARYFPNYSPIQQMETWAVLGGLPYYLDVFDDGVGVFENIERHILHRRGALYSEPYLLLLEELHDPRNYFSILRAIAENKRKLSEISRAAGFGNSNATGKYVDVLRQLGLVARHVSLGERQPEKSRKGQYQIEDSFLRFWFRFVHPNMRALSLDRSQEILETRVKPFFDHFVADAFVQAAQSHLANLADAGKLPFSPSRIGRWWEDELAIDVVAVNDAEKKLLAAECVWDDQPVGEDRLNELRRKAMVLNRRGEWQTMHLVIVAKRGFDRALTAAASDETILLVTIDEMV